jgi:hypothetical protein
MLTWAGLPDPQEATHSIFTHRWVTNTAELISREQTQSRQSISAWGISASNYLNELFETIPVFWGLDLAHP